MLIRTETFKIMGTHKYLCGLSHFIYVQFRIIMILKILPENIRLHRILNSVKISLSFRIQSAVKSLVNFFHALYTYIVMHIPVKLFL